MASGEAGGSSAVSRSKGHEQQSDRVQIPEWLQPFVEQSVGTATDALGAATTLSNQDRVADLTPEQMEGLSLMQNMLGSDYFGTAQDTFMQAAQGMGQGFLSPEVQNFFGSQDRMTADVINDYRDALGFTENDIARQALEDTAGGEYLYGGEAYDRAIQAASNAVLPQVASAFGGGVGGASGAGLARVAVGQGIGDAFANQYAQERRNMLGAANTLDAGGRADRALYSGLAEGQANRAMQGNQFLANMQNAERNRQMAAAAGLPDIGMLDANTQMQIGEYLQNQQQREIDAPLEAQLQLLYAALQGPGSFNDFLGSDRRRDYRNTNWGVSGYGSGKWGA